jgi:carboxypeptidase PM20D1
MKIFRIILIVACCNPGLFAQTLHNSHSADVENPGLALNAANILSSYIQIESVSGNEIDAGIFLSALSEQKGLNVRVFTKEINSYNFAASLYPLESGKPNVVFLSHIDVVPSGEDSLWTYPPFDGVIADGFVWGRGAIDCKSLGIMQLLAISHFVGYAAENDLPYNFTLLAVSNEELGGKLGAKIITEHFLQELNPVAVYGEGGAGIKGIIEAFPDTTYFGIEVAQKTNLWFRIMASDPESGHGSIPHNVYPAKQIALITASLTGSKQPIKITPTARQMFRKLAEHENGFLKFALRNMNFCRIFFPGKIRNDPFINALLTNTITVTGLKSSETASNQIAHSASATFDCRLLPGVTPEKFLEANRKHFGDLFYDIEIIDNSPMSEPSKKGFFYHALSDAIQEVYEGAITGPMLFPAINDNSYFREKGIPTYGLNPVIFTQELIGTVHYLDERIEIESLELGIDVYTALIRNILAGI